MNIELLTLSLLLGALIPTSFGAILRWRYRHPLSWTPEVSLISLINAKLGASGAPSVAETFKIGYSSELLCLLVFMAGSLLGPAMLVFWPKKAPQKA